MSTAIAKIEHQGPAALTFTAEQEQMIRDTFANGATPAEFAVFLEVAKTRRLNPILRQIHLVKRWNGQLKREVATPQVGIDGLRAIAERTGKYDGQDEPEYIYDEKKKLTCAKVKVYRKDWARPAVGVAHFSEYAQTTKEGNPTMMWASKPHIMLAKCAEALALRKAFPEDLSGLYTDDEMPDADHKKEAKVVEVKATPKPNGKKQEPWKGVVLCARDCGFDTGHDNAKLWAFCATISNKAPQEWTSDDYVKICDAILTATRKPEDVVPDALDEQPSGNGPENDIPF